MTSHNNALHSTPTGDEDHQDLRTDALVLPAQSVELEIPILPGY